MKELESKINEIVRTILGSKLAAIILFGSSVYMGYSREVDLLILIDNLADFNEKIELEVEIQRSLNRLFNYDTVFDVNVLDLKQLNENLETGSFLSGLALGYKIIYDKIGVEEKILDMLRKLSKSKYILVNKYGEWNLSRIAEIKLRTRQKNRY